MPLMLPKRVKYRKAHRGKRRGPAKGGARLSFGEFGLKSMDNAWIKATQLESARVSITRALGGGKLWIRLFPDKPVTTHGQEKTMGAGKGTVDHWVAVVKRGRVIFEVDGVPEMAAKEALRLASYKLPIRTKFVSRKEDLVG